MLDKADLSQLREIIQRQNTLESFVHKQLNVKAPLDQAIDNNLIQHGIELKEGDDDADTNLDDQETRPFKSKKLIPTYPSSTL